ncbi:MAG: Na/Pi cotransporter family protein [Oscillospiraceae bacterium]|nr:Na/Pi cotransporter family protein [Oscillospiraceae bacterium]
MGVSNVLALFGGVALFLFGMQLMGDGLKKVAGNKLELVLWKLSGTPLKGILLGTVVTAVIQSSSATSAMVVGFVNTGMMTVVQSISIVMGANIGTSITGWLLCLSLLGGKSGWLSLLSTDTISAVVAFIGIIWLMFSKKENKKNLGGIMLGFAVLMYGMKGMGEAVSPLKESTQFRSMLTMFDNPLLGILVGIAITALLQSNSASVGILQAISVTGAVTYSAAFPMIMGMGIGASIPVLLSAVGANRNAKRTALIYLLINVLGTAACTVLFYGINAFVKFPFMQDGKSIDMIGIAVMNTLYRVAAIILLSPFIRHLEKMTGIFLRKPETPQESETEPESEALTITPLEERFLENPVLALTQSREALLRMADLTEEHLYLSFGLLREYDADIAKQVLAAEDAADRYEDMLGTYLMKITGRALNHEQTLEISLYLHTVGDFERISDHSVNLQNVALEIHEKNVHFSPDALEELEVMTAALHKIVEMTFRAFRENDLDLACHVEPLEERIDSLCATAKLNHVARLQLQICTLSQGFVFNDIIGNFERIADHCSNIAVALVELHADSFDTHEYLNGIKSRQDTQFRELYEQYCEEFSFFS